MIEDVLTWVGALLGATMLIVMALGSLVLDYTDLRGERWRIFDCVQNEGGLERVYLEADRATHRLFVNRVDDVFVHQRLRRVVFKLSPETCERQLAGAEPLPSALRFDVEPDERSAP